MKTFESGHSKNVAYFDKLVEIVERFGSNFNPPANDIKLPSLSLRKIELHTSLSDFKDSIAMLKEAINQRQYVFEELMVKGTRVINEAIASGADSKLIADLRSVMRKLRGQRAKMIKEEAVETPKAETLVSDNPDAGAELAKIVKHSVSQIGFDNRFGNFTQLVKLLYVIPSYTPNEPDMTIASHEAFIVSLKNANKQVAIDSKSLAKVRLQRDKVLYDEKTGAVTLANRAKKYIKGAFGADSPEYALVKDLHFHTR